MLLVLVLEVFSLCEFYAVVFWRPWALAESVEIYLLCFLELLPQWRDLFAV